MILKPKKDGYDRHTPDRTALFSYLIQIYSH